jgi:hypothetical protein
MTFYIQRDGQPKEYSVDALKAMIKKGELKAEEYVFDGRTQQWVGATQVAELADAWSDAKGGDGATPNMAAAGAGNSPKSRSSKKFSETSWFMSAVTYEEGGLTPSEMDQHEVGDKFENVPQVPDELRKKFSLNISDLDEGKKK